MLAILALLTVRIRSLFWLFIAAFNLLAIVDLILDYYHAIQVGLPALAGAVGRHLRDPDHLRTNLMIMHVVVLYWLVRPQPKAARVLASDAAAS